MHARCKVLNPKTLYKPHLLDSRVQSQEAPILRNWSQGEHGQRQSPEAAQTASKNDKLMAAIRLFQRLQNLEPGIDKACKAWIKQLTIPEACFSRRQKNKRTVHVH